MLCFLARLQLFCQSKNAIVRECFSTMDRDSRRRPETVRTCRYSLVWLKAGFSFDDNQAMCLNPELMTVTFCLEIYFYWSCWSSNRWFFVCIINSWWVRGRKLCHSLSCKWHSDCATGTWHKTVGDYDPHLVSVGGGTVQEQPAEADRDPHSKGGLVHTLSEIQRVQAFRYSVG